MAWTNESLKELERRHSKSILLHMEVTCPIGLLLKRIGAPLGTVPFILELVLKEYTSDE